MALSSLGVHDDCPHLAVVFLLAVTYLLAAYGFFFVMLGVFLFLLLLLHSAPFLSFTFRAQSSKRVSSAALNIMPRLNNLSKHRGRIRKVETLSLLVAVTWLGTSALRLPEVSWQEKDTITIPYW